jgi:hypothetical protein
MFLQNVGNIAHFHTVQISNRRTNNTEPVWKPKISNVIIFHNKLHQCCSKLELPKVHIWKSWNWTDVFYCWLERLNQLTYIITGVLFWWLCKYSLQKCNSEE